MERSNSTMSNVSIGGSGSAGPFAYQTRLLERTSSRASAGSLSRSNSLSGSGILNTNTGTPSVTRRWAPSHRIGSSVDATRGKWEDRIKEASADNSGNSIDYLKTDTSIGGPLSSGKLSPGASHPPSEPRPTTFLPSRASHLQKTPTRLKRQTMPEPIIASPLSPNSTGVTVQGDSPLLPDKSSVSLRIYLPPTYHSPSTSSTSTPVPTHIGSRSASPLFPHPSNIPNSSVLCQTPREKYPVLGSPRVSNDLNSNDESSIAPATTRRRHRSLYGTSSDVHPSCRNIFDASLRNPETKLAPDRHQGSIALSSSSAMSLPVYRSSYMANKRYGEELSAGRRLGRHLPRIASGDVEETTEKKSLEEDRPGRPLDRGLRRDLSLSPDKFRRSELIASSVPSGDNVVGLPGRIQLKAPTSTPLPSYRGLWADTQRHLIQAYEYLCHVGEAQQWIEGCLGEELGFGVVEMEDRLRNGVVLAKLIRVFQGGNAVKKIYEAPKLDFRHSDNINYFFNFVRQIGLPEGFIFELTDLYEKKNLPKAIYCIHALSHLLSRRGMAERIGNLLGRLQFSDDQLRKTQKGLKDAGVAMPNFGNVGADLAKEINEEPDIDIEPESERSHRLLLEAETSIVQLQAYARGLLLRQQQNVLHGRMLLAIRHISQLQARCHGVLVRKHLEQWRKILEGSAHWVISLQASARGTIILRQWSLKLQRIRAEVPMVVSLQAHLRGLLHRRQFARLKSALRNNIIFTTKLQSAARARVLRNTHKQLVKSFAQIQVTTSVTGLQAYARGSLSRKVVTVQQAALKRWEYSFDILQAHCRGVLVRRRMKTQIAKLEDASHVVIRIQAAVRTYLSRKRLLALIRGLRKVTPMIVTFQSRARATIARQKHLDVRKTLAEAKTVVAVGCVQTLARAKLARNRHKELVRTLSFVVPDVVHFQASVRTFLARTEFCRWRDHLHRNHYIASFLQTILRGTLVRRSFREKMKYYQANLGKVIKIQSLFRAKETREQYRQLTMGKNVTVGTIKNFVHLLDDSEADFQDEIKVERLRKQVVESIRENQALENHVNDLDVKIALVVQNAKSFEDIIKARRRYGTDTAVAHAARVSLLAAHGDPFSGPNTLDQTARQKLESYQQLFYLLQTKGEYLSRLLVTLSLSNASEQDRRFVERVVLTLFGRGQDRREEYLLLKLFQLAIREEINAASSVEDIAYGHPIFINIAVHYIRPKQVSYVREAFQVIIREVINSDDLDLEADPAKIHRSRIEVEEMKSGTPTSKVKDVNFHEAIQDPETRPIYIRHLQLLQWWTQAFVTAIQQSVKKMPYGMRYLARETLIRLREKFSDASVEMYTSCVGRLVYYRYINPVIIAPETFDLVSETVDIAARKNLAQISRILTQIASSSNFSDDDPAYIPINDYVSKAINEISAWILEVADVPDADTQFHAHEFLDVTVQPKPIFISPNEIYAMHGLLSQHITQIAPDRDDILRVILHELDGVPHLGSEELKKARDTVITLELTNRFAHVKDPHAEEKTLWVQAKRGVLAILRVQPAQDLLESLMRPVTEDDESLWEQLLEMEMQNEALIAPRRQPSAAAESAYRLEDIRSLKFAAVKAFVIANLLELEKLGKISREDGFQGILNAIAGDVRSKHRKRVQRQQEKESMNGVLRQLVERKRYFEEQVNSYHNYVEAAMNTMQRGKSKKRFVLPFTKQYFHLRELQKSGSNPQFGSFFYTAKDLYDRGILLSIDRYSPRQFDKIQLTMSSNTSGVFTLLLESTILGPSTRIAVEDIQMSDLLQAKYEKRPSFSLFNGVVNVNLELFLYQINKKFYA